MSRDIKTFKEAGALVRRTWREAADFFFSLELVLMVLVAFAAVGGMWLAAMGDLRCLLPFGFAVAYVVARTMLHLKRILAWPFIG
jgi:hypothetical protein